MGSNINFKLEELNQRGVTIIRIKGELDVYNSKILKDYLLDSIRRGQKMYIFDMEDVVYINSYGLGILRGLLKEAEDKLGDIFLINLNYKVKNTIQMVGLDEVFKIYDNLEKAMEIVTIFDKV